MAFERVLSTVGVIVLSFVVGIASFYFSSDLAKEERKKQIDEISSMLVNFVIYVWIGKVLVSLRIFVEDPIAALAYPSNSKAFYAACLFISIHLAYKAWRKQIDVPRFVAAFTPVFFAASFVYEFIQMVIYNKGHSLGYISLLAVLCLFTFLNKRSSVSAAMRMWVLWAGGCLILTFFTKYVTVFGYIMERWILILFVIVSVSCSLLYFKKDVS